MRTSQSNPKGRKTCNHCSYDANPIGAKNCQKCGKPLNTFASEKRIRLLKLILNFLIFG